MSMRLAFLNGLKEQAPQTFLQLSREGKLMEFADLKMQEAARLTSDLSNGLPANDPNGHRMVEEQVLAMLLDLPRELPMWKQRLMEQAGMALPATSPEMTADHDPLGRQFPPES
jgi:hypothetical protein